MSSNSSTKQRGNPHIKSDNLLLIKSKIIGFISKNTVLIIAATLAIISCLIVKPDSQYLEYFDFKTLTCLFCTLAVICALKNIRFFTITAKKIVALTGNTRALSLALVYITFIGSMFLANDMALLTFLPLGSISLSARIYFSEHFCQSWRYADSVWESPKSLHIHQIQYTYDGIYGNHDFSVCSFNSFIYRMLLVYP